MWDSTNGDFKLFPGNGKVSILKYFFLRKDYQKGNVLLDPELKDANFLAKVSCTLGKSKMRTAGPL